MVLSILRLLTVLSVLALLAVSCDDSPGTSPGDASTTDQDVVSDTAGDAEADVVEDPVVDLEADVEDGAEEEPVGPCPGSIECYDPRVDDIRARICIENGFPLGTECAWTADRSTGCCIPPFACETDADCEAAREEEGFCIDERFACVCNTLDGSCASFVCLTDGDCEDGDVCRTGSCVAPGPTTGLVARIVSPGGVIAEGDTRQLVAVAIDPEDPNRVFEDVAIAWSTDSADHVAVSETGLITGGTLTGPAVITAEVADNDSDPGDTLTFVNYASSTADLRVVVIDESTREPVADAVVYVVPDSGDAVSNLTDELGVFEYGDNQTTLSRPLDVSVFETDHTYVTYVGVEGDDVLAVVPPTMWADVTHPDADGGVDRVCDEVRGEDVCFELVGLGALYGAPDMSLVANTGEVDVALTGFALGNSLLDLNFELIVGPNIKRDLSNGPIPVDELADIPGGVTLGYIGDPMVPFYVVTAHPGEHTVWSLGGRVSLSENPRLLQDIIEQVGGDLNIGEIIAAVLPLFNNFYSGITTDVTIEAPDGEDLNLSEVDTELMIPVSRRFFITPPTLPTLGDRTLETGLFLSGVSVPGEGFLPLGITAAADGAGNDPADGVLDGEPETGDVVDPVQLNMAPSHGGIRSPLTHYILVGVALALDESGGAAESTESTSGIIIRSEAGEALPSEITYTETAFPPLPEDSTYNADTRTVTIAGTDATPDFYRVLFKGNNGQLWQIHLPPTVTTYVVPNPTDINQTLEDVTTRLKVNVMSVNLDATHPSSPDYPSLLSIEGPTFDNLVDYVRSFTVFEVKN